jgi:metal-responsive CopG/Arc/MetJ family transcriptional regulator
LARTQVITTARIPEDDLLLLDKIARDRFESRSELIASMVRKYLDEYREKAKNRKRYERTNHDTEKDR